MSILDMRFPGGACFKITRNDAEVDVALEKKELQIETPDGPMTAHLARPAGSGPLPGVIVAMEAFGLNVHMKAVTDRIAAEGYVAIAPDFYHRSADRVAAYSDLGKAIGLMRNLT